MWIKLLAFLESYAEIFFIKSPLSGFIIFLLTWIHPVVSMSGIGCVAVSYGFAKIVKFESIFFQKRIYIINGLLSGFAVGMLFQPSFALFGGIISAGILSFIFTIILSHFFEKQILPVLSLPFYFVFIFLFLSVGPLGYALPESLPFFKAFLSGIGAILFLPYWGVGGVILGLILWRSRILFVLMLGGFSWGVFIQALYLGSFQQSISSPYNFNFCFIALALGGIFLVPSLHSYLIAMAAVSVSVLFIKGFSVVLAPIPVGILPFLVTVMGFLFILRIVKDRYLPFVLKDTPEQTLAYFELNQARFGDIFSVILPFKGAWTVWQGWESEWTHQGEWKYAYDFVIYNLDGQTFGWDGSRLDHYYCFRQPIFSPIKGRVTKVVNHLPDNPIGSVDVIHNWGNMVLIRHESGRVVELSHFLERSIVLKEGDCIEAGDFIGLCGNSGYSPQPHIHLHVQVLESEVGPTQPFCLSSFVREGQFYTYSHLNLGDVISSLPIYPFYDQVTYFTLGDVLTFDVYHHDKWISEFSLKVGMSQDSIYFLEHANARYYYSKQNDVFFGYPVDGDDLYLEMFYLAFPKLPLGYLSQLKWIDSVSTVYLVRKPFRWFIELLSLFYPPLLNSVATYTFISDTEILGCLKNSFFGQNKTTYVSLDPIVGIDTLKFESFIFKRRRE